MNLETASMSAEEDEQPPKRVEESEEEEEEEETIMRQSTAESESCKPYGGDANWRQLLQTGAIFRKYGNTRLRSPSRRLVWCSPELDLIHWKPMKRKSSKSNQMAVSDIIQVLPGESDFQSNVFRKHKHHTAEEARCLSILGSKTRLDIEAESTVVRDAWLNAIRLLIKSESSRTNL